MADENAAPANKELFQKFQEMAAKIVVSRTVFELLHDPVIESDIPDALQFRALSILRDRKVPNLTGLEKDRADFAEALAQVHKFNRLPDFFAKNAERLFADTGDPTVTLQSIVNLKQTFPKAELITIGRIAALRRTCRIVCNTGEGSSERGSGFLIGPQLVLTNWHVITAMLENGKEREGSSSNMRFEFDALVRSDGSVEKLDVFNPVAKWLVVASEAHAFETAGGGQGQNGPWPADPDVLKNNLDFAVIELSGTPGFDRGWYDVEHSPWPVPGTSLDLFQFPLGRAMTYLTEKFVAPTVFSDNAKPPRILHLVNAEKGSSGGLCLDFGSNAVALHQAGYAFKAGQNSEGAPIQIATINAAIPLAMITKMAGSVIKARIESAPRTVRMGPKATPILGRQRFQNLIEDARRGDIRIVAVQTSFDENTRRPRPRIGKSFSACVIMKTLLKAPENIIFTVASGRLTSDAREAARLIVETIQPHGPALPDLSGQTSLDADAIGTLVTPVINTMYAAAGSGVLWLVIDDLDLHPVLNESTTSTFLNALYKASVSQSKVRIVLIGPTGVLPGTAGLPCAYDLLEKHIDDDEVATWITGELGAALPILPQFANLLTAIARSAASELANDPLKGKTGAIAQVLQSHWVPNLRRRMGQTNG